MKVVLDTNVIVSRYLSSLGPPAQILERLRRGLFELLVSAPLLAEYEEVLGYERLQRRHGMDAEQINQVVGRIRRSATFVVPTETLAAVEEDPDDNKFLECGVAGGAEIIVSGDDHLLTLRTFRGIHILSPAAFLAFLDATTPAPPATESSGLHGREG